MDGLPDIPELSPEDMDGPPDIPELSPEDIDGLPELSPDDMDGLPDIPPGFPPEDDSSEPSLGGELLCVEAPSPDAILGLAGAAEVEGGGTDATSFFFPPQP